MRRAAILLLAAACGLPEPAPFVRVESVAPEGPGVAPEAVVAEIRFTAPIAPEGILDGERLALVPAADLREALEAVESDAGAAALASRVPAAVALADGGRRAMLTPGAPLRALAPYVLVLSSRVHAADGRPVLDVEGRRRPSVGAFETARAAGPPPRPVVTEVRADAATPEAGGEYVEIANRGEGVLDLLGWRLAKRSATGALSSCVVSARLEDALPPGAIALVAGGAYDGRYALPPGTPVLACGATALLGGIANERPPELLLLDPSGAVASTFGAGGAAPLCPAAAVRVDVDGPDVAENLACAEGEGTPGE
ncbi:MULTISPECIES: lamin tail domain-containing protein [Anaeromyxobacter]|uniref:lamin tail domain-containing protein n=1 Tax=Anaeromyxobacter TaxID=161492 RepID=UPI001F55B5FD|nr:MULTISPECIES: lamin tail domain-containing protein [unclassified Anaeromyxobacter]